MSTQLTNPGSRGQQITALQTALKTVYAVLESLPLEERAVAQENLRAIWRNNLNLIDLLQQAEKVIAESDSTLAAAITAMNTLGAQRNQAVGEVERLTKMLDQHKDSVWEAVLLSLPQDISDALGISTGDAQLLYDLLNSDADEFEEEGLTPELVGHFRATILDVFQQLKGMMSDDQQ